ncbi:MAG: DUF2809 domain-containing protein [Gemmatimonadaceae bacterium]|nr:DUF2809 domain-containing protein [Gemmatimonadaceae bacterium]
MSRIARLRMMYLVLVGATMALGLVVHWRGDMLGVDIRDVTGDALWAMMIAWGMGAWLPVTALRIRSAAALTICLAVEFSQLIHTPALDAARATTVGHLVLGNAFDVRDLVSYACGVGVAMLLERVFMVRH